MNKLMILGSMDEFVELVKTAQKNNIYTIVCDGYKNGQAKKIADKSYTVDIHNIEKIVSICKENNVNGIISSFSDILFQQLVLIADKANLKCYVKPEQLPYYREKTEMKKMFDEINIPYPKSVRLSKNFLDKELENVNFPVVIKPINGYGSRGIFVVNSISEIRRKFESVTKNSDINNILVEEYNNGYEFNLISWVIDGKVKIISIADREKSTEIKGEVPHVSRIVYPSRIIDLVYKKALNILNKIVTYTKVKSGPMCMQFFSDNNGNIEVCEINGRIFGYEHELVTYASGLSLEQLLIDYVYNEERLKTSIANHSPFFKKYVAGLYFHGHDGIISSTYSASQVLKRPEILESIIYYNEGDFVTRELGAMPYVVRTYINAGCYKGLDSITNELYSNLKIYDTDNKNIIFKNKVVEYNLKYSK